MTSRLAALVAAVLLTPLAVIAAPAMAQTCRPGSAELAFEELLDIAADGSPLEDQARRIADEQDARGAFESEVTLRRIEELAKANDLAYDCARRRYVPVQRPDPRDAIAEDREPVDEGPDGRSASPGTAQPGGGTGTGTGSAPGTGGRPGTAPGVGLPGSVSGTGTDAGSDDSDVADATAGETTPADPSVAVSSSGAGGSGAMAGRAPKRNGSSGQAAGESAPGGPAAPGEAAGGDAGAIAFVEADHDRYGVMMLAAGMIAAAAGLLSVVAARRRRDRVRPLV